uniref:Ovule protein n=1 Tax=Heterorhabditis bacteriophora TaxID=37862 RepID=A0A1I7W624_HETBA
MFFHHSITFSRQQPPVTISNSIYNGSVKKKKECHSPECCPFISLTIFTTF